MRPELEMLDVCIACLLQAAAAVPHSAVFILTNANTSWVHHASGEFFPRVHAWLQSPPPNFKLVSAKKPKEECPPEGTPEYEADVQQWKPCALKLHAPALQAQLCECGADLVQVVSIGDSPHDLEAGVLLATNMLESMGKLVKLVRMQPAPTVVNILGQLKVLCCALGSIMQCPWSFYKVVTSPDLNAGAVVASLAEPLAGVPTEPHSLHAMKENTFECDKQQRAALSDCRKSDTSHNLEPKCAPCEQQPG